MNEKWLYGLEKFPGLSRNGPQLSQDLKVSNGGPIHEKIPVKINRCLFKIRA